MEFSSPNIKNFLIFSLKKAFLISRKTELSRPPKTQEKIFIFIGDNLPVLIDYPDDVQVESPVTLMPLRETIGPSLRDDNNLRMEI